MPRISTLFRTKARTPISVAALPPCRTPYTSMRLNQVMAHFDGSSTNNSSNERCTLQSIPKSNVFTSNLPADQDFPTPQASHNAERQKLGPRMVKDALYTFVRPEPQGEPELLAVSKRALQDIGLSEEAAESEEFKDVVAGKKILTWDESKPDEGIYPWAQCYGGYQFGQWAGQLGDGRAISLFETTNPSTKRRYEIQLKGGGRTPYSRFADGRAVLRSSIREFVVSEYLNAINIPTTRALALTLNNGSKIRRERIEPGAIVARFAQSWIRFGTFDLPRMRGDRKILRTLADYTAEHVYGGWDKLPSKLPAGDIKTTHDKAGSGISKETVEGADSDPLTQENRYVRLYRGILRANARTVAAWQAYGFMNGVLNTDNTSILGLSIDFGPFAFLDTFDPTYTPNHDDHALRYSYRNQPTIIWWNLVRLGEALGELLGAKDVDSQTFVEKGVSESEADDLVKRAEGVIDRAGEEYKAVFLAEYKRLMTARLGLKTHKESDFDSLMSELLDTLEKYELDFHHAFRRLSYVRLEEIDTDEKRKDVAGRFFRGDNVPRQESDGRTALAKILDTWRVRLLEDWGEGKDDERIEAMKAVNPKFVPRSWILDELIDRVEKKNEREILQNVMTLTLDPFKESWDWNADEEERFCGDVPKYKGMMQCSCSS